MGVWVKSLFCVLIADEVCHVVPLVMSFDLNWYGTIVSGCDFQCRFDDCDVVMLFTVSGQGQEWAFSLYEWLSESQQ